MEVPPGPKLTLMLLTIRGGKATEDQLDQDRFEWEQEYGEPTEEKVEKWIAEHQMEIDLGLAASKIELVDK